MPSALEAIYAALSDGAEPGLDVTQRNRIKRFQDSECQRHERRTKNPPKRGGLSGGRPYGEEAELRGLWAYAAGFLPSHAPVRRRGLPDEVETMFSEDRKATNKMSPLVRDTEAPDEVHADAAPWDRPEWTSYPAVRSRLMSEYRPLTDRRVKASLDVVADAFVRQHSDATKAEASRILAGTLDRKPAAVLDDIKKRRGIGKRLVWTSKREVRRA